MFAPKSIRSVSLPFQTRVCMQRSVGWTLDRVLIMLTGGIWRPSEVQKVSKGGIGLVRMTEAGG